MRRDALRSIRSSSRAQPNSQRGYALIVAIVLAFLYFGLVELLLLDSSRELGEARRFRARIVAETLAENAAELAALQIVSRDATPPFTEETEQGTVGGQMMKQATGNFEIYGEGTTSGITQSTARVTLRGRIDGTSVWIQYSVHE